MHLSTYILAKGPFQTEFSLLAWMPTSGFWVLYCISWPAELDVFLMEATTLVLISMITGGRSGQLTKEICLTILPNSLQLLVLVQC